MDLSLDANQSDVKDLAAKLLDGGVSAARSSEPLGHDPALWQRLATSGICGMGLPESAGGGGAGLDLLTVVAEEVGRVIAPVPLIEHTVAGRLLATLSPGDGRLGPAAAGDIVCTLALRPPVDGVFRSVPAGAVANLVVARDGDQVVAIEGGDAAHVANHADAPLAHRRRGTADRVLASGPEAAAAVDAALSEWRVLTAAALVGVADAALALTLDYVKQRHQFGRPIGSFQALQHGLADFPGLIEGSRLLTHEAAWALSTGARAQLGNTGPELAVMALAFAGDSARTVTAKAIQYHGGYGYAEEQDPQLFYRRARGWSLLIGSAASELDLLADLMYARSHA